MTIILGLNHSGYDASSALIKDGKILAAITEERLNRQKHSKSFPIESIKECLKIAGLKFEDIDMITTGWNPSIHLQKLFSSRSNAIRFRPEYLYSVPNFLMQLHKGNAVKNNSFTEINLLDNQIHLRYVNHHLAHAASSFYLSSFKESAILSVDGFGEKETVFFGMGKGSKISHIKSIYSPHSIGIFYLALTEFLGFQPNSDEWKVMGASAYGNPGKYYHKIKSLVKFDANGNFEMDGSYFDYFSFDSKHSYSDKMVQLLGEPRESSAKITQRHYDIAAAAQKVTEDAMFSLLDFLYNETSCKNVVLSGGVAMNSLLNGKITSCTDFENVFVSPFPDDNGVSVGSALYYYHHIMNKPRTKQFVSNYLGPGFSNDFIKSELEKSKIKYSHEKDVCKAAARYIADGRIIGWFQGRMEFGQRALGNRSILADARAKDMKDKINLAIKFREPFRPFAPSILEEHYHEYFENAAPTPFMEKIFFIKKDKRDIIPAVTHVDGTGRLQTVTKEQNRLYWTLIDDFRKITNVPLILNTSFNLKGEPIVCTPNDAIRTFYSCGLDALFIGDYVIDKA